MGKNPDNVSLDLRQEVVGEEGSSWVWREEEQEEEKAPSGSLDVRQAVCPYFCLFLGACWATGHLCWVRIAVPLDGHCFLGCRAHGSLVCGPRFLTSDSR